MCFPPFISYGYLIGLPKLWNASCFSWWLSQIFIQFLRDHGANCIWSWRSDMPGSIFDVLISPALVLRTIFVCNYGFTTIWLHSSFFQACCFIPLLSRSVSGVYVFTLQCSGLAWNTLFERWELWARAFLLSMGASKSASPHSYNLSQDRFSWGSCNNNLIFGNLLVKISSILLSQYW